MNENRVLILSSSVKPGDEIDAMFLAAGMVPIYRPSSITGLPTEEMMIGLLKGVAGAIVPTQHITANVIHESPSLVILARTGVGYDAIDIKAATEHGIVVTNASGANRHSVAELIIALMLCSARKLAENFAELRNGGWNRHAGTELGNKTLGLIGFGAIGKEVAIRARAFSMRVLAYDISPDRIFAAANKVEIVTLEEILRKCDYVNISLNLNEATFHFMNAERLSQMKAGSCLINTSRGGVVDSEALCRALRDGPLGCAALDVFEKEPLPPDSPLRNLSNVYLSPHIGGQTSEAKQKGIRVAAENIICALSGQRPPCVVNSGVFDSPLLRMRSQKLSGDATSVGAAEDTNDR